MVSAYSQAPSSAGRRGTPRSRSRTAAPSSAPTPPPERLAGVEVGRLAGVDLAEVAAPGALVAADQEGGLAVLPALEDVRAARLLADRVQVLDFTSDCNARYSGPIRAVVLIQGGFFSIGTLALRTSRRSSLRPSGAMVTR